MSLPEAAAPNKTSCAGIVSTIIPCYTLERWPLLIDAVRSLREQEGVSAHIIVAVDNNRALYDRVVGEGIADAVAYNHGERGASAARNAGARLAQTDLIAFLDDDAQASNTLLSQLVRPFSDPKVIGSGGRVDAQWRQCSPEWFPAEFNWVVGASWLGMPTGPSRVRNVWAENMAVRRSVFETVQGFRRGFGKVGNYSEPEDTELCIRSSQRFPGHFWVYEPSAVVYHNVPADRTTFRFFVHRSYSEGQGKAALSRVMKTEASSTAVLGDEASYCRSVVPAACRRYLRQLLSTRQAALRLGALLCGVGAAAAGYAYAWFSLQSGPWCGWKEARFRREPAPTSQPGPNATKGRVADKYLGSSIRAGLDKCDCGGRGE